MLDDTATSTRWGEDSVVTSGLNFKAVHLDDSVTWFFQILFFKRFIFFTPCKGSDQLDSIGPQRNSLRPEFIVVTQHLN